TGNKTAGRTDRFGSAGLLSILELCGKERIFRDCGLYEERTAVRFLRTRDSGARQGGTRDHSGIPGILSGYSVHAKFPERTGAFTLPDGMGGCFSFLSEKTGNKETGYFLWRLECGAP